MSLATRECKILIFQEVSSRAGCDWESVYSFPCLYSCSLGHILGQPSQNLQTLKDMKIEMAASFLPPSKLLKKKSNIWEILKDSDHPRDKAFDKEEVYACNSHVVSHM